MKTSEQGLDLIKEREGCRLTPYLDSVGVWTDGVGNTNGVVPGGPPITMEKAMADLRRNIAVAEAAINQNVTVTLKQHEFDALASFVFNVGVAAFTSSTLLKKLNAGDFAGVPAQLDRWHIPAEITSRRNGEREQFRGARFEARI
jgi:lysozyme